MTADSQAIKSIFMAALEKPATDRAAYLDEACAGDSVLRRRIDKLLKLHEQPDAMLDQPAAEHIVAEMNALALDFLEPSTRAGSLGRLGHYDVLEVIGKGGMGVVFRAFDEKLRRIVAVKALAPALAGNPTARMRFVREAQAAAAVTHDNVIAIHAVEDTGPVPYLVMQFIDGCTLQQKIDRIGPLPLPEILRVGLQVAEGLAAAHKHGLTHRDIKPANILLENGVERVKITDFGLARAGDDDVNLTGSGYIAGTPAYMSPEQANGERVDYHSDLFSFGSVLYAMAAGHPPFQGDTSLAVLKRVCDETPRPLRDVNPELPEWLDTLVGRLQAKNPADRLAPASEVAKVLGRRLAQLQTDGIFGDIGSAEVTPVRSKKLAGRKRRVASELAVAVLVVAAASLAIWFGYQAWFAEQSPENPGTPSGLAPEAPPGPVVLKPSRTFLQHAGTVRTVAFSRDGKLMASGGFDRHIYLWDTRTWEARGPLKGHSGHVSGLAFNKDGTRLASVTSSRDECPIRIWDVETGKQTTTLGTGEAGMWDVAYSPDGATLACGGWDKTLHVFDVATGEERFTVPDAVVSHLRALSFSADGQTIATGGRGPTRLWNSKTGEEIPTRVEMRHDLCPTILPDGKGLVGWSYAEGRATICDLPSGQVRATWKAHKSSIEGLAVSADGRFIATIGNDGVARVWATADQREVATLIGHRGCIFAVAISPSGELLVTGGEEDQTVRVWELPAECQVKRP
jgi:WD40 repeat protein